MVRLNGKDAFAVVARSKDDEDQPGAVFVWVAGMRWVFRRDLDPDEIEGLIEWRHTREERSGDSWKDDDYDPA